MNISNSLTSVLDRLDNSLEQDFSILTRKRSKLDYIGLMRRLNAHLAKHPNSALRELDRILADRAPAKIDKLTKKELADLIRLAKQHGCEYRMSAKHGVLAIQTPDNQIETFRFSLE